MPRRRVRVVRTSPGDSEITSKAVWDGVGAVPSTLPDQMGEADFQATCELVARRYQWTVYHEGDSRKSDKGLPDLICLSPVQPDGTVVLAMIELKARTNKPTLEQEVWLMKLGRVSTLVTGWVKPSDWPEVLALFFDPSGATGGTVAIVTPTTTKEEPTRDPGEATAPPPEAQGEAGEPRPAAQT